MRKIIAENPLSKLSMLFGAALIVAALYLAQDVFIPLALALLLTFVLSPLADWLEHRGLPRAVAAVGVVFVVCCMTLGLGYVVGDQVVGFAQRLPEYQAEISNKINLFQGTGNGLTDKISRSIDQIKQAAEDNGATKPPGEGTTQSTTAAPTNVTQATQDQLAEAGRSLQAVPASQPTSQPTSMGTSAKNPVYVVNANETSPPLGNLTAYLGLLLGPLGTAGLVLVLVLFMLLERDQLRDRFIRLISGGRYTLATQALNDATTRVSRYLRALLIVNGSYGIAIALGLYVISRTLGHGISFPSFILWGVLCAVLRFIPYIGPWVAAAFPIAVSLAVYPGFGVFFAVVIMFLVIELFSNNFMEPILYGSSTGLSTVALLVAAIIWTWLWGPYGLLLSTPLTVCLVVLGKHVPQLKFLDVLLGDQPALPPSVRLYQRLLAGSYAEAAEVARERSDPPDDADGVAMPDRVIVPALQMARHDRGVDEMTAAEETKFYQQVSRIIAETAAAGAAKEDAKKEKGSADAAPPTPTPAADGPLVVGLPAHHRSEMLAVQSLGEMLKPLGARVEQFSCSMLPADVESRIGDVAPAAVVIAVMPPGGTTQARYLCRRLRRRFKDLTVVVVYLGTFRDFDRLLVRFRASGATYVTTSLEQARSQVASSLRLRMPESDRPDAQRQSATLGGAGSLCDANAIPVTGGPTP